ncbi:TPA: hypothetical protein ACU967_002240 [Burkholderia contaminans]|uniref:hypothetical protein n=1 Tax=Burkholderia contaminans TaxID=488447 RepID=UPI000CFF6766|nr:hypothetical protein [Burkholderia contaminans]HDR9065483.1 hypothetical protein [Burkholderia vietnamiensis]MBM6427922.1 hypothetical protein [Burkholderia contaminans]MCA7876753.1 hypothetical protein [Burkholderia contaminans]MDN8024224.1 hypothetical protein [Burkholderia contaminans]PRG14370.1 hypothetical protein C6Q17_08870 [Burkholderia contaminans]
MTATVKTEKATVAPRRSIEGPGRRLYLPGEEIELPAADVKALRASGFLVDPKAAVKRGNGPESDAARRPVIRRVG